MGFCNFILFQLSKKTTSQSSSLNLPIGTILPYVGELSDIPSGWHLCDGSNGTPNLSGRFLEGVTSGAKQWHQPGLPNITGAIRATDNAGWNTYATGAFRGQTLGDGDTGNQGGEWKLYDFNASRSSAVYGNSTTVQPASYTVYYIMRMR